MTIEQNIFCPALPIDDALPSLLKALRQHHAVILSAPPGSGKTTRVPLALLNDGPPADGLVLMLEPRRVAARSVASYMSETLNEPVGKTIGYQVRMERRMGKETRVLVVTEGILTRRFISDPLLEDVSCVIIDEFHERSVHVDLALCLLREALTVRDDLRVIVMSATINAAEVSAYLGNCPIVDVVGTPFPLKTVYTSERTDLLHDRGREKIVASAVRTALSEQKDGDILVFLPGAGDIEKTRACLQQKNDQNIEIMPLYGALSPGQQDDAIRGGTKRRVVLATNIAETSLTIPNVRTVIDTGLEKRVEWRSGIGFEKLVTGRISRFSATQRAGRAARTAPGTVYRLWHASQDRELTQSSAPEILRTDPLSTVFTLVASFCKFPGDIDLLTPLRQNAVEEAMTTLQLLGLINNGGNGLTETGKRALQLPVHPRLALVIIAAAQSGLLREGATAAAILEERPMLAVQGQNTGSSNETCDIGMRRDLLNTFESRNATPDAARRLGLDFAVCRRILERRHQFERIATAISDTVPDRSRNFLLHGFWDRVCRKDSPDAAAGVMATGRGVTHGPTTQVRAAQYFIALDAVSDTHRSGQRSEVELASAVSSTDLETEGARFFKTDTELELDDSGNVVAFQRTRYMKLLWRETRLPSVPPDLRSKVLATQAMANWKSILFADASQQNALCRLALAKHLMSDIRLPSLDPEGIRSFVEAQCELSASISDLKKTNWAVLFTGTLPRAQLLLLDQWFPLSVELPSGRRAQVDYMRWYQEKTSPIIRVKLQELFGLQKTPPLADGRISLSIALLAPNGREVQITNDLKSFWKNTYPQVRRELRARYARHFWPEDPLTAIPTHLTQKQFKRQNRD